MESWGNQSNASTDRAPASDREESIYDRLSRTREHLRHAHSVIDQMYSDPTPAPEGVEKEGPISGRELAGLVVGMADKLVGRMEQLKREVGRV